MLTQTTDRFSAENTVKRQITRTVIVLATTAGAEIELNSRNEVMVDARGKSRTTGLNSLFIIYVSCTKRGAKIRRTETSS